VLKFHHPKSKIQNPKFGGSAFSLTEVVIAMGVAAVAFTSIIALFPLGLNMSKESYESTQAALIAQTIMADLKDSLTTKDADDNYAKLIQKGGDTFVFDTNNYATIALISNNSTTFFLAYDEAVRPNSSLQPILIRPYAFSTNLPPWYTAGAPKAFAIVKVTISKTFLLESGSDANPQKIDVWVETPGRFRETNRVQFLFTGVIPQQ
jgi:type II secretory pathway pseudopilin PulG